MIGWHTGTLAFSIILKHRNVIETHSYKSTTRNSFEKTIQFMNMWKIIGDNPCSCMKFLTIFFVFNFCDIFVVCSQLLLGMETNWKNMSIEQKSLCTEIKTWKAPKHTYPNIHSLHFKSILTNTRTFFSFNSFDSIPFDINMRSN